jgi:hypothetical protein
MIEAAHCGIHLAFSSTCSACERENEAADSNKLERVRNQAKIVRQRQRMRFDLNRAVERLEDFPKEHLMVNPSDFDAAINTLKDQRDRVKQLVDEAVNDLLLMVEN